MKRKPAKTKEKYRFAYRSAVTGQFITPKAAARKTRESVLEKVRLGR